MRASLRLAVAGAALVALTACAALGVPKLHSFDEKVAGGYTAITTARTGALELLQAHEIMPSAARDANAKLDQLRGGLDLAERVHRTDPGAGETKLVRALSAIGQVQGCVDVGKADFSSCIERVPIPQEGEP